MRKAIISPKLFLILVLIAHWIIPVEFPYCGEGGGMFRAALYIILLFLINRDKTSTCSKDTKRILILYAVVFFLRFASNYLYYREIKFYMYYIWEIVFIYILSRGLKNNQEIRICCYVLLGAILFSIMWGYLIVKFVEPFQTIRYNLIGVSEDSEDYGVLKEGHEFRIVGFSKSIFAMGYLIAAAGTIILTSLMSKKKTAGKILLYIGAIIVFIGLVGNAERSSIASIAAVLLFAFTQKKIGFSGGLSVIIISIACAVLILSGYIEGEGDVRRGNLIVRMTEGRDVLADSNDFRLQRQIYGLISSFSIVTPPNDVYQRLCEKELNDYSGIAPHNHFITVAQAGPFVLFAEVFFLVSLIKIISNLIQRSKQSQTDMDLVFIIVSVLLSEFVSSFFHNTGLFSAEPSGVIVMGLLCALLNQANNNNNNKVFASGQAIRKASLTITPDRTRLGNEPDQNTTEV